MRLMHTLSLTATALILSWSFNYISEVRRNDAGRYAALCESFDAQSAAQQGETSGNMGVFLLESCEAARLTLGVDVATPQAELLLGRLTELAAEIDALKALRRARGDDEVLPSEAGLFLMARLSGVIGAYHDWRDASLAALATMSVRS